MYCFCSPYHVIQVENMEISKAIALAKVASGSDEKLVATHDSRMILA